MPEPVLTVDAGLRIDEMLQHLHDYPAFGFVAIRAEVDGRIAWFGFEVAQLRWLLQDGDAADTLYRALELDQTAQIRIFEGMVGGLPADFGGLVVAGDQAIGYVAAPADISLGTFRGSAEPAGTPPAHAPAQRATANKTTTIAVFYATDRAASGSDGPHGMFGAERAALQYGRIEVSIPPGHERGDIETPKWWKFEFKADPEKHVTLVSCQRYDEASFLAAMGARFEETEASDVLVFVHGYNVAFDDGIRRTAQIAADLRFKGVPVLYSWPSASRFLRYTQDENNARWTEPHFTHFLDLMLSRSGASTVHVVAHSMGNRVVTESLRALPAGIDTSPLHQLVLAAPDIDADTFGSMVGQLSGKARQITLYASSHDLALRASKLVHGYPRAGDSEPKMVVVHPVVTIDASRIDTNPMGHSYIGDSKSILADVYHLLATGAPPERREFFLQPAEQHGAKYWVFVA